LLDHFGSPAYTEFSHAAIHHPSTKEPGSNDYTNQNPFFVVRDNASDPTKSIYDSPKRTCTLLWGTLLGRAFGIDVANCEANFYRERTLVT
jgi:hypothetical protein